MAVPRFKARKSGERSSPGGGKKKILTLNQASLRVVMGFGGNDLSFLAVSIFAGEKTKDLPSVFRNIRK